MLELSAVALVVVELLHLAAVSLDNNPHFIEIKMTWVVSRRNRFPFESASASTRIFAMEDPDQLPAKIAHDDRPMRFFRQWKLWHALLARKRRSIRVMLVRGGGLSLMVMSFFDHFAQKIGPVVVRMNHIVK